MSTTPAPMSMQNLGTQKILQENFSTSDDETDISETETPPQELGSTTEPEKTAQNQKINIQESNLEENLCAECQKKIFFSAINLNSSDKNQEAHQTCRLCQKIFANCNSTAIDIHLSQIENHSFLLNKISTPGKNVSDLEDMLDILGQLEDHLDTTGLEDNAQIDGDQAREKKKKIENKVKLLRTRIKAKKNTITKGISTAQMGVPFFFYFYFFRF